MHKALGSILSTKKIKYTRQTNSRKIDLKKLVHVSIWRRKCLFPWLWLDLYLSVAGFSLLFSQLGIKPRPTNTEGKCSPTNSVLRSLASRLDASAQDLVLIFYILEAQKLSSIEIREFSLFSPLGPVLASITITTPRDKQSLERQNVTLIHGFRGSIADLVLLGPWWGIGWQ